MNAKAVKWRKRMSICYSVQFVGVSDFPSTCLVYFDSDARHTSLLVFVVLLGFLGVETVHTGTYMGSRVGLFIPVS